MSLEPGRMLLHYRIVEKIGEGGMGEVWKAVDTTLDREVAIKVLPASFAAEASRLARFEREAKLLATLNHANIGAIHSVHEAGGVRFLAMEWVPGVDLAARLEQGPLPVEDALRIARQIAEALDAAHERGVIHRDLKPANIKSTPDGTVKVLDFGLAKALDVEGPSDAGDLRNSPTITRGATAAGMILGTAGYMSPEQARGRPVDRRTDIWSFGCVLFEMLSGRRSFPGETVSDSLAAILTREPELDSLPRELPPRIVRLLRRCLDKEPRRRLQAIGEARIEIEEVLAGNSDLPAPAAAPAPRTVWPWVAALAAGIAGILAGTQLVPPPVPREPVRLRQLTFSGGDHAPAVSPDGRLIAFASIRDDRSRIWIKQLAGGGEQPLTEGPDREPTFFPDGSSVLFLREERGRISAYRTALVGGQPRLVLEDVIEAEPSPDGRRIAFIRGSPQVDEATSRVGIFDVEQRSETILLELPAWDLYGVRWAPDGRRIAVTRGAPQGAATGWKILLVDPADGSFEEVPGIDDEALVSNSAWTPDGSALVVALAANTIGDQTGIPARVVRLPVGGEPAQTLFWSYGLFPFRGSNTRTARFGNLGRGRLVFDVVEQRESLRELDAAGKRGRRIPIGSGVDRQPAYSPDGTKLIFASNRTGNLDIWTFDFVSGELRQLTDDAAQDWDPGFTPDGNSVLYSSNRSGNLEIWIVGADGGNPRQITRDGVDAENPTMTADGEWIVYSSGNPDNLGILKIRPDGSDATMLAAGNFVNPEVSPDGRHALYVITRNVVRNSDLRVVDVATGEDTGFAIQIDYDIGAPNVTYGRGRWMPGGGEIAYLGIDDRRRPGVFAQQFLPGRDTAATRRPLAGFLDDGVAESFGLSPHDGRITLAVIEETRSLMMAEGVPGIDGPAE